jgi:hypothetical protein
MSVALQSIAQDPFSGDTLKLHGMENRWRRRTGSYRIFFAKGGVPFTQVATRSCARRRRFSLPVVAASVQPA